jgi:high-affinity iron transporter
VDLGSFTSGLLTGLREGVEAALIISILLAYLARTGNRQHFGRIWVGTGAAVVVSLVAGMALFVTVGELQAPWEQVFEGLAMLLAASVVTWMLFWMRRQSGSVRGALQAAMDRALTEGAVLGLVILAFTAVIREGLETSLFLVGLATSSRGGAPSVMLGAVGGLLIAVLLGAGFYRGSRVINLRTFFRWTTSRPSCHPPRSTAPPTAWRSSSASSSARCSATARSPRSRRSSCGRRTSGSCWRCSCGQSRSR